MTAFLGASFHCFVDLFFFFFSVELTLSLYQAKKAWLSSRNCPLLSGRMKSEICKGPISVLAVTDEECCIFRSRHISTNNLYLKWNVLCCVLALNAVILVKILCASGTRNANLASWDKNLQKNLIILENHWKPFPLVLSLSYCVKSLSLAFYKPPLSTEGPQWGLPGAFSSSG